ncbi:TerB family tellurite resistance protein [Paraburkholderia xenovorans]|uniref:TerB family tellurite resistance protein n=1 Tax=Paraburkholderia xenovorans TaxID=36873 RepID=UPI0038BBE5AF
MRTYPRNSPQAAARIVALALIADGHVCSSEERVLDKLDIAGELGLVPTQFAQIVQTLCEDLSVTHATFEPTAGRIDAAILATLIDEVDDPILRRKIIRLCMAVTVADDYLADGEVALLAAVLAAWGPTLKPAATRRDRLLLGLRTHERTAATT